MEAAVRWSPHSTDDRKRFLTVDVSNSSLTLNQVDDDAHSTVVYHAIARHEKLAPFGAFAWDPINESVVAIGYASGNASLLRLGPNTQSSDTIATFKTKQQRKCNSVAISTQSWVAVALDKTRSDVCLNIYDAQSNTTSLEEPVRRLCAAELVSSVRFFPGQPREVVATTSRAFIRVIDLRDSHFGGGSSNLQASTRNVNNVTIDPLDENFFASAGSTDDPSVTIWDRRWMSSSTSGGSNTGAIFHFHPAVENLSRTSIWSLRYSGQRRGRLAVCASNGELKVIDMIEGHTSLLRRSEYLPNNAYGGTVWTNNRHVSQMRKVEKAVSSPAEIEDSSLRTTAFDWIDSDRSNSQSMLVMRANRDVNILQVPAHNVHACFTGREDFGFATNDVTLAERRPVELLQSIGRHPNGGHTAEGTELQQDDDADTVFADVSGNLSHCRLEDPRLAGRFTSTSLCRDRCEQGYQWNLDINRRIVAGYWQLERLWEIIDRFSAQATQERMVYNGIDLSYLGVNNIWSESLGNWSKRSANASGILVDAAITGLVAGKELPDYNGQRTDFPEHRQLCLAVCGWQFTLDDLETECQELIERGLYYQAIVQAVLHEHKHMALNLLRTLIRNKIVDNTGLGALLASDRINDEQREMCLWMAADTDDPALKALLTFLSTGDWRDVMKTNYLHLGYRVALGLKYLNDTELSGFIQSETARAIKNGDLEGILLTGLSEQALDLFQTYITKTNDIQTAVLALAYTNPRYVDDFRWDLWKETYLDQMQTWKAFHQRVRFNVQHSRMARTRDGQVMLRPAPGQMTLRCNHCHEPFGSNRYPRQMAQIGPSANAGTVCLQCGRHMPRCAICNIWLGTPDPAKAILKGTSATMARLLSFCISCGHGYHTNEAQDWFRNHAICPVTSCRCACATL